MQPTDRVDAAVIDPRYVSGSPTSHQPRVLISIELVAVVGQVIVIVVVVVAAVVTSTRTGTAGKSLSAYAGHLENSAGCSS